MYEILLEAEEEKNKKDEKNNEKEKKDEEKSEYDKLKEKLDEKRKNIKEKLDEIRNNIKAAEDLIKQHDFYHNDLTDNEEKYAYSYQKLYFLMKRGDDISKAFKSFHPMKMLYHLDKNEYFKEDEMRKLFEEIFADKGKILKIGDELNKYIDETYRNIDEMLKIWLRVDKLDEKNTEKLKTNENKITLLRAISVNYMELAKQIDSFYTKMEERKKVKKEEINLPKSSGKLKQFFLD